MNKLGNLARFFVSNFGPIIIFYGVNHFYGLKPALVSSVVWTLGEIAHARIQKSKTSAFFKYSAAITIVFGLVDLYLQQSFLFKYEASATSVLIGLYFASTLTHEKTLIQEFAESQGRLTRVVDADLAYFFKFLTATWAISYFAKAIFYMWVASHYSLEEGLAIRAIVGNGTLYGLLFVSIFCSKGVRSFLVKARLMPSTRGKGAPLAKARPDV